MTGVTDISEPGRAGLLTARKNYSGEKGRATCDQVCRALSEGGGFGVGSFPRPRPPSSRGARVHSRDMCSQACRPPGPGEACLLVVRLMGMAGDDQVTHRWREAESVQRERWCPGLGSPEADAERRPCGRNHEGVGEQTSRGCDLRPAHAARASAPQSCPASGLGAGVHTRPPGHCFLGTVTPALYRV